MLARYTANRKPARPSSPRPAGPRGLSTSDCTNAQWARIAPFMPPEAGAARPRTTDLREVVNAILYLLHEGCHWALPHDFPPPGTVRGYFDRWCRDGTCSGSTTPCGTRCGSPRNATPSPLPP